MNEHRLPAFFALQMAVFRLPWVWCLGEQQPCSEKKDRSGAQT